jgi:hypothetical protein
VRCGLVSKPVPPAQLGPAPPRPAPQARRRVARAYIEFVERRPLPQHAALPPGLLAEAQRRDGFEAGSADHIFASTTLAARGGGGGGAQSGAKA